MPNYIEKLVTSSANHDTITKNWGSLGYVISVSSIAPEKIKTLYSVFGALVYAYYLQSLFPPF